MCRDLCSAFCMCRQSHTICEPQLPALSDTDPAEANGIRGPHMSALNVASGSRVVLAFRLVDSASGERVAARKLRLKVFDLDSGASGMSVESVHAKGFKGYVLSPGSTVQMEEELSDLTRFKARRGVARAHTRASATTRLRAGLGSARALASGGACGRALVVVGSRLQHRAGCCDPQHVTWDTSEGDFGRAARWRRPWPHWRHHPAHCLAATGAVRATPPLRCTSRAKSWRARARRAAPRGRRAATAQTTTIRRIPWRRPWRRRPRRWS